MPRTAAIRRADLQDLVLGHLPDAHAVGREAGAAVVEDRRDPAQELALDHPAQVLEEAPRCVIPTSAAAAS